MSNEHKNRR